MIIRIFLLTFLCCFFIVSGVYAQSCVQPPSGLVGWWPGDNDGSDIENGNNGVLMNGALAGVAGRVDGSFSFDGIDDFVSVPHMPNQNIQSQLTIDAWIMRKGPCSGGIRNCLILTKRTADAPCDAALRYALILFGTQAGGNGKVGLAFNTGTWENVVKSNSILQNDTWYHVAGTWDGSTAKIYINGVLDHSAPKTGLILASTGGGIAIGREAVCTPIENFNGQIDELELFDRALTATEILGIYNAGSAGKCKQAVVEIDVKPGSDPNCFNVNGSGVIPVAILGSDTLDVLEIDTSTLFFGGLGVRVRGKRGPMCHVEFSNGDGFQDLVCQFEDDPSMWAPESSSEATLVGQLGDGSEFGGTDSICIVP